METYWSKDLSHLGLVAGMIDKLELVNLKMTLYCPQKANSN